MIVHLYLFVLLSGERVQVTRVGFGGDNTQKSAPSQIHLYFSIDKNNYTCIKDSPNLCRVRLACKPVYCFVDGIHGFTIFTDLLQYTNTSCPYCFVYCIHGFTIFTELLQYTYASCPWKC